MKELLNEYVLNITVTLLDGLEDENIYLKDYLKQIEILKNELKNELTDDEKDEINFLINWYK